MHTETRIVTGGMEAAILALSDPFLLLFVICQMFVQPHTKARCRAGRESSSAKWGVQHQGSKHERITALGKHINPSFSWQAPNPLLEGNALSSLPCWEQEEQGMTQDCSEQGINYSSPSHVCRAFPRAHSGTSMGERPQCGHSSKVFSATSSGKCKNTNKAL